MKQILLSYALAALCTGRKTVRVHLRHYALYPHVLGVNVAAQRAVLPEMPHSIISIGGTTPKTGIEAGRPVSTLILPVTLYVNAGILPECKASNIAAEFKTLLENPVLLLL